MLGDFDKVPRIVSEFDLRKLSIEANIGFLVSQIDGELNVSDLADLVLMEPHEVQGALEKLVDLGAVEWVQSGQQWQTAKYNATELREEVDLDESHRKRVLDKFYALDSQSHYELLSIPPDADKSTIRQAYFRLSKVFHPDTLYGKKLGSYQAKMEAVFKRLTDAYEVLGKKQKRQKYDAYLTHRARAQAVEKQMVRTEKKAQAMERVWSSLPPAQKATPKPKVKKAPPKLTKEEQRRERKRALMKKKLKGLTRPPPKAASKPASKPASGAPQQPGADRHEVLRALATSLKMSQRHTAPEEKVRDHLRAARDAEEQGDLAQATTSLRMAMALSPEAHEIQSEYARVNTNLKIQLVDIHREQATYEEENEMWQSAAISWAKVAQGEPDNPMPLWRAARSIFKAQGNMRKAREYAQRALELKPESVPTHVLLARIYLAANMEKSAKRHLESAAKLDPSDEIVKNLLSQL